MEKIIAKHETNDLAFSIQTVSVSTLSDWRKTKEQTAERRNLIDV